ncbi:MAG: hypothetical protein ACO4AY_05640 [Ilumatobacteraceae bacterium]
MVAFAPSLVGPILVALVLATGCASGDGRRLVEPVVPPPPPATLPPIGS